jgi:hypothetical protein
MNAQEGWHCQFLEDDLKTSLPRIFTFATSEKVEELIRRVRRLLMGSIWVVVALT